MRIVLQIIRPLVLTALTLTSITASTLAQEVPIPDPLTTLRLEDGRLTNLDLEGNQLSSLTFRES